MRSSNVGEGANWKRMLFTAEKWRAIHSVLHVVFSLPNVTHHNVEPDELHIMHIGTCALDSTSIIQHDSKPKGNDPKLQGRGVEVKGLVPALRHVWERCHNTSDEMHTTVLRTLGCKCEIQSTIHEYANELFFTPAVDFADARGCDRPPLTAAHCMCS